MVHVYDTILYSHPEKRNKVFFRKTDRTENHQVEQNKPDAERQSPTSSHIQNIVLKSTTITSNNICVNIYLNAHIKMCIQP